MTEYRFTVTVHPFQDDDDPLCAWEALIEGMPYVSGYGDDPGTAASIAAEAAACLLHDGTAVPQDDGHDRKHPEATKLALTKLPAIQLSAPPEKSDDHRG